MRAPSEKSGLEPAAVWFCPALCCGVLGKSPPSLGLLSSLSACPAQAAHSAWNCSWGPGSVQSGPACHHSPSCGLHFGYSRSIRGLHRLVSR